MTHLVPKQSDVFVTVSCITSGPPENLLKEFDTICQTNHYTWFVTKIKKKYDIITTLCCTLDKNGDLSMTCFSNIHKLLNNNSHFIFRVPTSSMITCLKHKSMEYWWVHAVTEIIRLLPIFIKHCIVSWNFRKTTKICIPENHE